MEVWLVVQVEDGGVRDLAVRAPSVATVSDVATALAAAHHGVATGGDWSLFSHRLGAWLSPSAAIQDIDLRHGDIVAVTPSPAAGEESSAEIGPALIEITATAGPQVGQRFAIAAGDHVIGRGEAAAVRLSDPFVASEHARLSVRPDRVTVTDLGAERGTLVDDVAVSGSRVVKSGQVIRVGGSTLAVKELRESTSGAGGRRHAAVEVFNRPPRVIQARAGGVHRLAAPPSRARRPRLPLVTALVPLALGAMMLAFIHNALTLVFLAMSPVLAVASYVESRMGGRGDYRRAATDFRGELGALMTELEGATAAESDDRHAESPDLRRLALAAHRREAWLWQRRPQDDDFLELRVGRADLPSRHTVEIAEGGDTTLRAEAMDRLAPLAAMTTVPVVVAWAERGTVGLAGPRGPVLDTARWLVVQASTLHSPRNLSICAAVPNEEAPEWDWLKWLPHTGEASRPFEGAAVCTDNASARDLVGRLVALLEARSAEIGPFRGTATRAPYPYVMAVLHEDLPLSRSALTRLLSEGPRVGIVVLWIGSAARDLPNECHAVLEVDGRSRVTVTYPAEGKVQPADAADDRASAEEARQVALELAPLRDSAASDTRGQLPLRVGLLDALALGPAFTPEDILARWAGGTAQLSAPIGVGAAGPFILDLRGDGPHALVGGTTGAGKSELLQTLVASLGASHSPRRLNFLLVDYKGGSAFKDAVRLPHTVGLVTDLDGHLANRALVSLRAELRRRERVLRDAGTRDLAELERRADGTCPPSLVIVIDEFATLAREVPEFVDGVVDLAQRGRSLGLHLVLATQRPAGVINDNIRANTNLRVALRMNDDAESTDVIGVPDAARIPRNWPGRAFARTGHRELTEFQAAYAGSATGNPTGETVQVVALGPAGPGWITLGTVDPDADETTDLHRLVAAVNDAHAGDGGDAARRPWLPELPPIVPLPLPAGDNRGGLAVALGIVDLPETQRQNTWVLDLSTTGGLLVLGTGGSGKTSLLRTLAYSLAGVEEPSRLHVYAIDCGGGALAAVQALPHCGAYVRADESERLGRLIRWLRAETDARREHNSAQMGTAQGAAGRPVIVVILDGYGGFVSAMDKVEFGEYVDAFPRLVADGPPVGIHYVLTADRRAAIPGTLTAVLPTRLVLRLADEDEYRNAGLPAGGPRSSHPPPGRGFLGKGDEVQCAVLGQSGSNEEQVAALQDLGAALAAKFGPVAVPGIHLLPSVVSHTDLPIAGPLQAVVGLADTDLSAVAIDLSDDGQLVVGPPHSGRSNTLAVAAASLREGLGDRVRLVLLAPRRTPLAGLGLWDAIAEGGEQCELLARQLADQGDVEDGPGRPTVVVVDDGEELAEGPVAGALTVVARRGRDTRIRLLAAVETRSAHRAYSGWIPEVRKARQGLLLQPDLDIDGDLLGARLPRRAAAFPVGRGFLVRRGGVILVQVGILAAT
ncbi:MAG: FtsK/SpoIIIE domain-containing protein [Candidatus Dormibacteria bacterium]